MKRKTFWTDMGLRQGCPLSSRLFLVLISDIKKKLRKEKDG